MTKLVPRPIGYLFRYKRYARKLKEAVGELERFTEAIKSFDDSVLTMDKQDVNRRWVDDAGKAIEEARLIFEEESRVRFCKGCYHLGRKAKKMKGKIESLVAEAVSTVIPELSVKGERSVVISELGFNSGHGDESETTSPKKKNIWLNNLPIEEVIEALSNEDANVIGVCGVDGSGKTSLVKQVVKQTGGGELFDEIAEVTESWDRNPWKIQTGIAKMLDLTLEKSSLEEEEEEGSQKEEVRGLRAAAMYRRLNNNRILIVLYNISKAVDLEALGVPIRQDSRVKILLTSRDEGLLRTMRCQRIFNLRLLTPEESWIFFEKIVGVKAVDDDELKQIVITRSRGFPKAVRQLAVLWRDLNLTTRVRKKLAKKQSQSRFQAPAQDPDNPPEMEASTASSYVHEKMKNVELNLPQESDECKNEILQREDHKSLLQICALRGRPSKVLIQDLFCHCMGLGLLQGQGADNYDSNKMMRKSREDLDRLLQTLQASSLLLKEDSSDYVAIEESQHKEAIKENQKIIVIDDESYLGKFFRKELMDCQKISLLCDKLGEDALPKELDIPEGLEFPELKMFLMEAGEVTPPILSDSFFECMKKLKVLHLMGPSNSFPSSVARLSDLTTLCLHGFSELENVTLIGNLKNLQILSFRGSGIAHLPKDIGELTQLRMLDMNSCKKLKSIEPNVLGKLVLLEELYMDSFDQWEDDEVKSGHCCSNARVSELSKMPHLSKADLLFRASSAVEEAAARALGKCLKYKIQIGDLHGQSSICCQESRTLAIKLDWGSIPQWLHPFLKHAQDLRLYEGTQTSFNELTSKAFHNLRHLRIQDSPSIQYILKWYPYNAFSILESLFIENMSSLEMMCRDPLMAGSLRMLRSIKITKCEKLKNVFHLSWLKDLSQLQEIEISDCEMMQEIVTADVVGAENNNNKHVTTALRHLTLKTSPNITQFCSDSTKILPLELSEIESKTEQDAAFLSEQHVSFPMLESLALSSLEKLKKIWSSQHSNMNFFHLKSLEVDDCQSLSGVCMPSEVVPSLKVLESLTIRRCNSMQQVFDMEGLSTSEELLPQLKVLKLEDLPSLTRIVTSEQPLPIFPKLKYVKVKKCGSLQNVFTLTTARCLCEVEVLRVIKCEQVKAIIELRMPTGDATLDFPMLELVKLKKLPHLTNFVYGTQDIACPQLLRIYIKKCPEMKAFSAEHPYPLLGNDNATKASVCFFSKKVSLQRLEGLILDSTESVEMLWTNENPKEEESFSKLRILYIAGCKNLQSSLVPPTLVKRLQKLEVVTVINCASLEVLFDCSEAVIIPNLRCLVVWDLEQLKDIFKGNSHEPLNLTSLEFLYIRECKKMKQVVSTGKDGEQVPAEMSFKHINELYFYDLDSLECFASGDCVFEFPKMETLDIRRCSSLKTFIQRPALEDDDQFNSTTQMRVSSRRSHSLFDEKVKLPGLEKLIINAVDMQKVWSDELDYPSDCLGKLKSLEILECKSLETIAPSNMLEGLQSLETLVINDCIVLKEIFQMGRLNQDDATAGINIKDGNSQLGLPSLKKISVSTCENLIRLFPHAIARTLSKLECIEMDECERMQQIVSIEDCEEQGLATMSFPNLHDLKLSALSSLKCFSSGGWLFAFPSLETLAVFTCTSLKTFIQRPSLDDDPLNSKKYSFFDDKVEFPKLDNIELYNVGIQTVWNGELPTLNSFCKLKSLQIDECKDMVTIIPSNMLRTLQNLETLTIKNCTNLEKVIFQIEEFFQNDATAGIDIEKGGNSLQVLWRLKEVSLSNCKKLNSLFPNATARTLSKLESISIDKCESMQYIVHKEDGSQEQALVPISFPHLYSLELLALGSLKAFASGGCVFDFPSLVTLRISRCPSLKSLIQRPAFDDDLSNSTVHSLFDDKVNFPKLEAISLTEVAIQEVWNGEQPPSYSFSKLKSVAIADCQNLETLAPRYSRLRRLQNLQEKLYQNDAIERINHEKLKDGNSLLGLPTLKALSLSGCNNLIYLFTDATARTLSDLESIEIVKCESLQEVVSGENSSSHSLFDNKVEFPNLETVRLYGLNMQKVWNDELHYPLDSIIKLRYLLVEKCPNLVTVAPSNMLNRLQNLEEIVIKDCIVLKEVFQMGEQLNQNDACATIGFEKLKKAIYSGCPALESLQIAVLEKFREDEEEDDTEEEEGGGGSCSLQ